MQEIFRPVISRSGMILTRGEWRRGRKSVFEHPTESERVLPLTTALSPAEKEKIGPPPGQHEGSGTGPASDGRGENSGSEPSSRRCRRGSLSLGERIPRTKNSRVETLNQSDETRGLRADGDGVSVFNPCPSQIPGPRFMERAGVRASFQASATMKRCARLTVAGRTFSPTPDSSSR